MATEQQILAHHEWLRGQLPLMQGRVFPLWPVVYGALVEELPHGLERVFCSIQILYLGFEVEQLMVADLLSHGYSSVTNSLLHGFWSDLAGVEEDGSIPFSDHALPARTALVNRLEDEFGVRCERAWTRKIPGELRIHGKPSWYVGNTISHLMRDNYMDDEYSFMEFVNKVGFDLIKVRGRGKLDDTIARIQEEMNKNLFSRIISVPDREWEGPDSIDLSKELRRFVAESPWEIGVDEHGNV